MTLPRDTHGLIGAYALDALPETERREFETHLADCPTCAQELPGLRETAARLGAASGAVAPPGLRARVLAEAARTRQVPPRLPAPRRLRRRHGFGLLAAACLVVALVLAGYAWHELDSARSLNDRIAAVLTAPDATTLTAPVSTGGTGTVVFARSRGQAVVALSGLGPIPRYRTYELWVLGDRPPRPAGLTRAGRSPVLVDVGDGRRIGLTVEPRGGSAAPTSAPVFAVAL